MTYELGQPVNVTGTAVKQKSYSKVSYTNGPLPTRQNYDNPTTYDKGFIVGSRHVTEGEIDSWEDGRTYVPSMGTSRRVWLVAFNMHMKPAMCFDHQVSPIKEES